MVSSIERMTSHIDSILGTKSAESPAADYPKDHMDQQFLLAFVEPERLPRRVQADFGSVLAQLNDYLGSQTATERFNQPESQPFPFTLSPAQMQYFLGVRRVAHGLTTNNDLDILGGYQWQQAALQKLGDRNQAEQLQHHIATMQDNWRAFEAQHFQEIAMEVLQDMDVTSGSLASSTTG